MERALKVVLVVVGLLFVATIYPLLMFLWQPHPAEAALTMMMSVYATLGVFVLLAARNPSAHRSLIAFTAWSSFAHAAVMVVQSFQMPSERVHLLIGFPCCHWSSPDRARVGKAIHAASIRRWRLASQAAHQAALWNLILAV